MTAHQPTSELSGCPDVRSQTDRQRAQQRLIKNDANDWVLLHHADVLAAAKDDKRFSSQVSRFLQVPNGLDGAEHTQFRTLIERYLTAEAITPFVADFERIAQELMVSLPMDTPIEAVSEIGAVFAVRAQSAWLGWPASLEPALLQWVKNNNNAAQQQDPILLRQVADDFDDIIRSIVRPRREAAPGSPLYNADDITSRLCRERIDGRLLSEEELVSILRNWTGGDLGSIALCVGVIMAFLAQHPEHAQRLAHADNQDVEQTLDEIIRLDNPFVSNRRITTCPVTVGEHTIAPHSRVYLNWTSANRDESVFGVDQFKPSAHAPHNLVYGAGKHVCPGRLLATWQLRITTQALLKACKDIRLAPNSPLVRERPPLGGYSHVWVLLS
ncbi:cytochrome P450 [Oceanisphaera avium]|uniref:Cytochrome P450 n=1 Tax=Oceanisphaera avium TaxID=1903694 RepID=A0A1Y0CX42_9GAMM|nr:cytochrome P450 [Oceanisphaera avium]ART79405.1 cytochrome P450 [Oceanisphaera avium]